MEEKYTPEGSLLKWDMGGSLVSTSQEWPGRIGRWPVLGVSSECAVIVVLGGYRITGTSSGLGRAWVWFW